jgi:NAD(P)-dependent dehydrogenase (short-subunit alcohol dehydrogenase family)
MGPGVSLSVARRFGREGYAIAAVSRNQHPLPEPGRAYLADAGDEQSLRQCLRSIRSEMGDPEVLVYNASAGTQGTATSLHRDSLVRDFDVNVVGAVIAAQECAPAMVRAGRGTILISGGGLALQPMAGIASLSLGKAAIRSLSFSLAKELEPAGIHVATVTICGFVQEGTRFAPGLIADEYWRLHTQPQGEWQREVIYK